MPIVKTNTEAVPKQSVSEAVPLRRSSRQINPPKWMGDFVDNVHKIAK